METRTAERDATTVEMVFALVTGAFLAALVGGAAVAVTVLFPLPGDVLVLGGALAALVFAARIVRVLTAWRRLRHAGSGSATRTGTGTRAGTGTRTRTGGTQPSHPGRTSPVS
jgi:Family of unknown function (DUF6332)